MSGPHSAILPDTTFVTIPAAAGLNADSALDWLIDVDVFETAVSHTGWDTLAQNASALLNGYKNSSLAQNDEINWDVVLAAGTWTFELMYLTGSSFGIFTLSIDGSSIGTIDSYSAGTVYNVRSSVSGVAVTVSKTYRFRLKMETKNASATNYGGYVQHIQLRRTA